MTTVEIIHKGKPSRTVYYVLDRRVFDASVKAKNHENSTSPRTLSNAVYTSSAHMYSRHLTEHSMGLRTKQSLKRNAGRKGRTLRDHRSN